MIFLGLMLLKGKKNPILVSEIITHRRTLTVKGDMISGDVRDLTFFKD